VDANRTGFAALADPTGLVTERKEGTRRLYQVDPGGLEALRSYFEEFWTDALAAFKAAAEAEQRRSE